MYRVVLSRRAERGFRHLPLSQFQRLKETLRALGDNPRMRGTVKLENAPVAQYRHRVGDYRILFDIDEENKIVEVLDIRRRSERRYS